MELMNVARVDVDDVTAGAVRPADAPPDRQHPARQVPRRLAFTIVLTLAVGVLGAVAIHAAQLRTIAADRQLTVTVTGARQDSSETPTPGASGVGGGGRVQADVTLTLQVSVPVRILAAELDGAPPVSRPDSRPAATRAPAVTVRWQVLCAEVGTIPGPRLLDVDVRARSGVEHRRVRLATNDSDAVSRVFRLSAAQACATSGP